MRVIPEDERKFNELQDKYFDKFGKNYGAFFGCSLTFDEHNAIMEKALKTGVPVAEPVFRDGVVI